MSPSDDLLSKSAAVAPLFAGIDLGGTNIQVGIVDDEGRTLSRHSVPTSPELGPEEGARRMAEAVAEAAQQAGIEIDQIARVGLGSPGTMDIPSGMLLDPPNLSGWNDFPIRDRVSEHCGRNVSFANDATAAAYGEYWIGSGQGFNSMVLLTLGTGVGGGIIVGDRLIDGEHGHGAECGHLIIDYRDDARVCPCGQPGHLEAYCSAKALVKRAGELLDAGRESSLSACLANGEQLTPLLIGQQAETGDPFSLELIMEMAMFLGVGIATLMHTIDPNGVVLGGAMTFGGHRSELGRKFLSEIIAEVHRRAFPTLVEKTKIDFASLGGNAGYIGAAGIARVDQMKL